MVYCMQAADWWRNEVDFCFQSIRNVSMGRLSGHQTQAGDLSREEGVEDEDNWFRA